MATELILQGRVQGVCCRYYCSKVGQALGVRGASSNLYDGTVQVLIATENREKIAAYIATLRENRLGYRFWGTITNIEVRPYSGPIQGDYEW
jgi:acylphosphatase